MKWAGMPHAGHVRGIDCDGWYGLVPLAARPGVHPRRNEVFLLELLRMANQRHVLTDAYVPRTPCLEVPNRPEPPMVHNVLGLRSPQKR